MSDAITKAGQTHIVQVNGQLYQVNLAPIEMTRPQVLDPQPQYPAPIQQQETWVDALESRGLLEQVRFLFWIAVGGMSIALVIALIRALTPQPVAPQANQLDPNVAALLQQQQQVTNDLRNQNAQLFQQLQAKPVYERHCTPGFLGFPVCSEIRRAN